VVRLYENGRKRDIEIPKFIEYLNVKYPDPISELDDGMIRVYRVQNCRSLMKARTHYAGHHVFGVERMDDPSEVKTSEQVKKFENPFEALKEMIREMNLRVSRQAIGYLKEVLNK